MALFLSVVACAMSGYVFFQDFESDGIVDSIRNFRDETKQAFADVRSRLGDKSPESLRWDRVRERVDRVEGMVRSGDERADYYLEVLSTDLSLLRDYATEKSAETLGDVMGKIGEIRAKLTEDRPDAVRRLRALSESLAARVKSVTGGGDDSGADD